MKTENLKNEIAKFFKGDVLDDEQTLEIYSHDASLFEVRPVLVVFPKDSEDLKALVKWVNENKEKYKNKGINLAITARSAGTDMSGGALGESIILDFTKYMNKLIEFKPATSYQLPTTITVQPGMYYHDFEKIAVGKNLMLPSYPASKSICAVGGMVANNSGGEKTLRYGKTEDYVLSMKVILSDGNEYLIEKFPISPSTPSSGPKGNFQFPNKSQIPNSNLLKKIEEQIFELITDNLQLITKAKPKVSKNSAGYYIWNIWDGQNIDLNKLLVGSQGTLGIITEITFKLVPVPETSKLTVIYLDDVRKISSLTADILKFQPESLEVYDDKTLKLAIKFFPKFLEKRNLLQALRFAWSFWPDLFMLFRHGFPKLVVLAEFAGAKEATGKKSAELLQALRQKGFAHRQANSKEDAEKYWEIRRESFNLLRKHVKGKRTAPFIDDVIVKPEHLSEFLPELQEILSDYPQLEHTIAGHAGDGNFHIIPLVEENDPRISKIVLKVSDRVYDLVLKYGGSIDAEHNDGIIRTPYLQKMYGPEVYKLFEGVKKIFDPLNIFNPGKKVGGTKADILKYLAVKDAL